MPDTEICLLRFIGVRVPLSKDRQGPGDLYFSWFLAYFGVFDMNLGKYSRVGWGLGDYLRHTLTFCGFRGGKLTLFALISTG